MPVILSSPVPPLPPSPPLRIVDENGLPTKDFLSWMAAVYKWMKAVEAAFAALP